VNTLSVEHAAEWEKRLGRAPQEVTVRAMRLEDVLTTYVGPSQKIDVLSVDVESHDLAVLRSNDWQRFRPELVVVEADLDSQEANYLRKVGYEATAWLPPSVIFIDRGDGDGGD
jgi:hypothetical protein